MAKPEKTRDIIKRLRAAGFEDTDSEGSHTKWVHPTGVQITVATGHRVISAGVVRKIDRAIQEAADRSRGK